MKLRYTLVTTIVLAIAGVAHAADCSGGSDGGMDATGNECSVTAPTMAAAPVSGNAAQAPAASRSPPSATPRPYKSDRHARTRIAQAR